MVRGEQRKRWEIKVDENDGWVHKKNKSKK
jgi:hypothetical protein